jgi:hypothetical protein
MLNIYTVRNKEVNTVWEFKYCLKGHLVAFNVLGKSLTSHQKKFLFLSGNFPATENIMKDVWMTQTKTVFEIEEGEKDYSFKTWLNFYGNKNGKPKMAEKSFNRLKKSDVIELYKGTERYHFFLKYHPNRQMQDASTFINQQSYLSEWKI